MQNTQKNNDEQKNLFDVFSKPELDYMLNIFKRSIQTRLERFALDAQECFVLTNALSKMDARLVLLTEEATLLRNELKLLEGLQKLVE